MEVLIRDVELADAEGLVGILNPIIEARIYTALDPTVTVDGERDYIRHFSPRGVWKVALDADAGRVVGFQILEPFATYTRAFDHVATMGTYVDLALRRHGIAGRLFAATFDGARAKGYAKILTFVRADNPAALRAYLRHGFSVIGTASRQARIDGRYIDEILIEKWLADA